MENPTRPDIELTETGNHRKIGPTRGFALIIAALGVQNPDVAPSIKQIQRDFWKQYGRTFFTRYDYENVDSDGANKVVGELEALVKDPKFVGSTIGGKHPFPFRSD